VLATSPLVLARAAAPNAAGVSISMHALAAVSASRRGDRMPVTLATFFSLPILSGRVAATVGDPAGNTRLIRRRAVCWRGASTDGYGPAG
jgi:hypothetical protein